MTERETAALAASGAVAGLAPTTEADLGDGTFPGVAYLDANGRFGVGSDSNTQISPFAGVAPARMVAAHARAPRATCSAAVGETIGTSLWLRAARGGAQALGAADRHHRPGLRADLVVLDATIPRWQTQAAPTCSMPRSSVRLARRCATCWRAAASSCATAATRRRTRCSPAIAPRSRGWRTRMTPAALRPAARRRPSRDHARGARALRRDSRRRRRHSSATRSHGSAGARDLPRDCSAPRPRCRAGRLADAGTGRLPHASRLRGQSRRRVRAPPAGRDATPTSRARAAASPRRCARRARRARPSSPRRARPRLAALAAEGVTTVEIKSGYGLDTAAELKQLRVARALGAELDVDGAHDAARRARGAARVRRIAPTITSTTYAATRFPRSRATASPTRSTRSARRSASRRRRRGACSRAARAHGLPVKLHADQLSDMGGARARGGGVGALRRSSRIHERGGRRRDGEGRARWPCSCPARSTRCARRGCRRSRRSGEQACRWRSSTDCNPGTSPTTSLLLMLNMACTLFGLTPEEALAGATVHAARALGLRDRGTLAPGLRADLACWAIAEPAELAYRIGGNARRRASCAAVASRTGTDDGTVEPHARRRAADRRRSPCRDVDCPRRSTARLTRAALALPRHRLARREAL